jgi:hypothetical protein
MISSVQRERSQFTKCIDTCHVHPCCHGAIEHWQRTRVPDPRTVASCNYTNLKVYTMANRPKYRRCWKCAALLFESERGNA